MALLVASLVRFLVYVLFEVPLLAVIQIVRAVALAFAYALLVLFVFRVVLFLVLVVVLEEWSCHGLDRACTENHPRRYRKNPATVS